MPDRVPLPLIERIAAARREWQLAHTSRRDLAYLERGVSAWNKWRLTTEGARPNLSNIDLSGADLSGADLSRVKLTRANLSGARLVGTNFTGADLGQVDFSGANLREAVLVDADAIWAKFVETNLEDADLRRITSIESDFIGANLLRACLSEAKLSRSSAIDANFTKANLERAKLPGANFSGANLSGASLQHSEAREADLSWAKLVAADLRDCNLVSAILASADFTSADLRMSDLSRADARGTSFQGANLTGACLESWLVDDHSHLEEVLCEYVYFGRTDRVRCPEGDRVFGPGQLANLFYHTTATIDLVFPDGLDWPTFVRAFAGFARDRAALQPRLQMFEHHADGRFTVRVELQGGRDLSAVRSNFWYHYSQELTTRSPIPASDDEANAAPLELLAIAELLANYQPERPKA